jgi:seryl-tRNA synthetase
LPNVPLDDVPVGEDENDNVEVRLSGQKPAFDFEPKEHFELGEALGQMDFETAAKIVGFALHGGQRRSGAAGAGARPVHAGQAHARTRLYRSHSAASGARRGDVRHRAVAEIFGGSVPDTRRLLADSRRQRFPLTNLVREEILDSATLPRRYTALTPCFRSEAGSAGRDTRGYLRQHQFYKVELVSITDADTSLDEHERMTKCAETILEKLGLHFRTVVLCTGDMGFGAQQDLRHRGLAARPEHAYREISSCSVCGDFQARRMNARCRAEGEKDTRFVHTLNGSGVAVGRALIAVMENYQNADGTIRVPAALKPYMGGIEVIGA